MKHLLHENRKTTLKTPVKYIPYITGNTQVSQILIYKTSTVQVQCYILA